MADNKPANEEESTAEKFAEKIYRVRIFTATIGLIVSCVLIYGGFLLTQQNMAQDTYPANGDSKIEAKFLGNKFVLQNTAPGLVLIICGTLIGIATISKQTRVRTEYKEQGPNHSTYNTEVEG